MLMNCCYLSQQHLHLLTAVGDKEVTVQMPHSNEVILQL